MEPLSIEPASPDDLARIVQIDELRFPDPWSIEDYRRELQRPVAQLQVARLGGEVVGFINYWVVGEEYQLVKVATDPQRARQGVGRQLTLGMLASASLNEASLVTLEVRRSNLAAIALYESFGFVEVGVRSGYYGGTEDALLMNLDLQTDVEEDDEEPDIDEDSE